MALRDRFLRYVLQIGIAEDETFDAITGGSASMTFSRRVALAAQQGDKEACFVCACLSWMVQKDHCAKTLDPNSTMNAGNYLRACFFITLALALLIAPLFLLFRFILGVLS